MLKKFLFVLMFLFVAVMATGCSSNKGGSGNEDDAEKARLEKELADLKAADGGKGGDTDPTDAKIKALKAEIEKLEAAKKAKKGGDSGKTVTEKKDTGSGKTTKDSGDKKDGGKKTTKKSEPVVPEVISYSGLFEGKIEILSGKHKGKFIPMNKAVVDQTAKANTPGITYGGKITVGGSVKLPLPDGMKIDIVFEFERGAGTRPVPGSATCTTVDVRWVPADYEPSDE